MKKLLFWGPVLTCSGYGHHARQLLKFILRSGEFDVSVVAVNWGSTPFLDVNDKFAEEISVLQKKHEFGDKKYDVAIQVTIPNEFKRMAPIHIGVTAGIEVDRVSPEWIIKANNEVDLVIVPSRHSAETYANIVYTNANGEQLKLNKPLVVLPEAVDSKVFNTTKVSSDLLLESDFNFLSVGLGFDKPVGEDRKNLGLLVKYFCETFAGNKNVGLVLKSGIVGNSVIDYETCRNRIQQIKASTNCGEYPRVKLIHGRLTDAKLAELYKHPKIKSYVSFTHGEGYGLPMIEAAACGLPVLVTNWSGHLDFLHLIDGKKRFVPIEYDLTEIPQSSVWNGVMEKGTRWASVKEQDAKMKMKKISLSVDKPKEWALELASRISLEFSEEKLGAQFIDVLSQLISSANVVTHSSNKDFVKSRLTDMLNVGDKKTLIYTMPMSAGDVFVSTAIVDSLRKKFPDHFLIFATDSKYMDILKSNASIDAVIRFENWMTNVGELENVFNEVYTPNLAVQLGTSNWVHGGKGRKLVEEFAAQCQVELGKYFIQTERVEGLPEKYIVFHPGSGKGQWEARNYKKWKKVIHNLKRMTGLSVVQVGAEDDATFEGVEDFRGKTNYNQLAFVIQSAKCLVGIDSVSMHIADALRTPYVSLFGSSYPSSTGPAKSFGALLETPDRLGCKKACYKYQCKVDKDNSCINQIDPELVVKSVVERVGTNGNLVMYDDVRPKIAGYTHVLNAESHGFPYIQSIKSMLGFCDEVVVVDGGSNDGTVEKINAIGDERVKLIEHLWDSNEPGMDGLQKAFGRAMCSVSPDDFLWQQDADEVVSERDYEKIKKLADAFPSDVDILHLPVVELWGDTETVRTDRHSWKWRLTRNNFKVTHGINKDARAFDEKTGMTYAKKGMSDGCEFIDIMNNEFLPHKGFYTQELEHLRLTNPDEYGRRMNDIFKNLPSVFHFSWANIERKINDFKSFWNVQWSKLYNDPEPLDRFPDVKTDEDVKRKALELKFRGGEHGNAKTFKLSVAIPEIMKGWM